MEIKHENLPGTGVVKLVHNQDDPASVYITYKIKEIDNLQLIIDIDYDYTEAVKKRVNNFTLCFHEMLYTIYSKRTLPLDENSYILYFDYTTMSLELFNPLSLKIKDIYKRSSKEHFKLMKMFEGAVPLLQSKGYKFKFHTNYIEVNYKGINFRVHRNLYALLIPCPDRMAKTILKRNNYLFKLSVDKLQVCKKFTDCVVSYLSRVIKPYDNMLNILVEVIEEK